MSATDEMRDLLDQLYASFGSGSPTVWESDVADDVIGIGSDRDEWWEGRTVFMEVVTRQLDEMSRAGVHMTAGDPRIFENGAVVWAVDRPILHLSDGTDIPMRVTMLAISEAGTLRIKHGHYSVGSS